jgi:beta-galactosidase/beta-glucuronidase
VTTQTLQRLFDAYRAAHFTTIRVWGGGVYVSDAFLDLADTYVLLLIRSLTIRMD